MSNDLQRLVSERMAELGLSYRRAAAKSGGKVSHGTLNTIATGRHSWRVDDSTIEGIALALDVDESVVRAAVGRAQRAPETEFVLPRRANRLSAQERRAVLSMVDALLAAAEKPTTEADALAVDAAE
jgi:hypothetical protein